MKNNFILLLVISTLLMSACRGKKQEETILSDEAIPVKLIRLYQSKTQNNILASGVFTTDDETYLSFKTGGLIKNIYVNEGDKIKRGQLLASLDVTEVSALARQAKLAVGKANRDYERIANLYKDSVASLEQLQNAKTGKEIYEQQYAAATFNLEHALIKSVADGVVLRKLANPGQVIAPGVPVLQTSSKGSSDWLLKIAVSDKDWSVISIDDSASIVTDAIQGKSIPGIVTSKSENVDPTTGSFAVDITLIDGQKLNLASGMFGSATVFTRKSNKGWVIPYEALLDGNSNSGFVFVTSDKKIATKVPVTISKISDNEVIISEGLKGYQYLVTSGSAYLTDQSNIKAINP